MKWQQKKGNFAGTFGTFSLQDFYKSGTVILGWLSSFMSFLSFFLFVLKDLFYLFYAIGMALAKSVSECSMFIGAGHGVIFGYGSRCVARSVFFNLVGFE